MFAKLQVPLVRLGIEPTLSALVCVLKQLYHLDRNTRFRRFNSVRHNYPNLLDTVVRFSISEIKIRLRPQLTALVTTIADKIGISITEKTIFSQ